MTEKTIHNSLIGKPPADSSSSPLQYDLTRKCVSGDTQAMLKRNLTIIVAAVIMDDNNNVLLIQEAKRECRGQWYLPAGRLEENETLEEGVKREVEEEAGVKFKPTSLILVENMPSRLGDWIRFTYTGTVTGKLKTTGEADKESLQAKWFSLKCIKSGNPACSLRAHDVHRLIDACEKYNKLSTEVQRSSILPCLKTHTHMAVRLMLARKIGDTFDVLTCTSSNQPEHLPVIQDMGQYLPGLCQKVFGESIPCLEHRSVLCVEHQGKSKQIFADGVCLTVLVFTATDRQPKDEMFAWHKIQDDTIKTDLDRRMMRPEIRIPLI